MLEDRRSLLTTVADKFAAREYIAERVGPNSLPTLVAVGESANLIDWKALPNEYVAKVTHGSGGVVAVTTDAWAKETLPPPGSSVGWANFRVAPENADPVRVADLCRHWLTLDYSWVSGHRSIQWCYEGIERKVMVEELLRDDQGLAPREYRLFVIGGRVRFLQVEMREAGTDRTAVMSPEWEWLPARFLNPPPSQPPQRPPALGQMVEIAETLAAPLEDFLRVDFYDLGSRVVVGELTNYPYGGVLPVRPRSFDRAWARYWPTQPHYPLP